MTERHKLRSHDHAADRAHKNGLHSEIFEKNLGRFLIRDLGKRSEISSAHQILKIYSTSSVCSQISFSFSFFIHVFFFRGHDRILLVIAHSYQKQSSHFQDAASRLYKKIGRSVGYHFNTNIRIKSTKPKKK